MRESGGRTKEERGGGNGVYTVLMYESIKKFLKNLIKTYIVTEPST